MPLSTAQTLLDLPGKVQAIRVSALTVPENELSRRARENLDALNAEEYDLWYCTAYVSSLLINWRRLFPVQKFALCGRLLHLRGL